MGKTFKKIIIPVDNSDIKTRRPFAPVEKKHKLKKRYKRKKKYPENFENEEE